MAYETLVTELTRAIQSFIESFPEKANFFTLVMLLRSPSTISIKWDLVVSSPILDDEKPTAAMLTLSRHLKKSLPQRLVALIDRINLIFTTDEFARNITSQFQVPFGTIRRSSSVYFNGALAEDAYILLSQAPSVVAANRH